jgi:uncharacterized protein YdeI (YjbR/CyaY-like superfamily)
LAEVTRSFRSDREWERWLEKNHATASGIWMKIAKKGSGVKTAAYPEVLDTALCYGWIDALRRPLDDVYFLQRFTPRGARSKWSQNNREKVLALIKQKRMRPAGYAEIERAKKDGRWADAYEPQSRAEVPPDLQAALDTNPKAKQFFATLDSRNRYAILFRLRDAKKPETRAARLEKFVAMLNAGDTLHPR